MNDESKPAVDVQAELDALSRKGKRFQAISRLGKSGDVRALEPLLDMCREANGRERRAICRAVSRLAVEDKSRVIVATLIRKGLSSPHARVQRCAASLPWAGCCMLKTIGSAQRLRERWAYVRTRMHGQPCEGHCTIPSPRRRFASLRCAPCAMQQTVARWLC